LGQKSNKAYKDTSLTVVKYILNSNSSLILLIIHKTPLDGITMKQTKERQLFRFFFLWTKKEDLHFRLSCLYAGINYILKNKIKVGFISL